MSAVWLVLLLIGAVLVLGADPVTLLGYPYRDDQFDCLNCLQNPLAASWCSTSQQCHKKADVFTLCNTALKTSVRDCYYKYPSCTILEDFSVPLMYMIGLNHPVRIVYGNTGGGHPVDVTGWFPVLSHTISETPDWRMPNPFHAAVDWGSNSTLALTVYRNATSGFPDKCQLRVVDEGWGSFLSPMVPIPPANVTHPSFQLSVRLDQPVWSYDAITADQDRSNVVVDPSQVRQFGLRCSGAGLAATQFRASPVYLCPNELPVSAAPTPRPPTSPPTEAPSLAPTAETLPPTGDTLPPTDPPSFFANNPTPPPTPAPTPVVPTAAPTPGTPEPPARSDGALADGNGDSPNWVLFLALGLAACFSLLFVTLLAVYLRRRRERRAAHHGNRRRGSARGGPSTRRSRGHTLQPMGSSLGSGGGGGGGGGGSGGMTSALSLAPYGQLPTGQFSTGGGSAGKASRRSSRGVPDSGRRSARISGGGGATTGGGGGSGVSAGFGFEPIAATAAPRQTRSVATLGGGAQGAGGGATMYLSIPSRPPTAAANEPEAIYRAPGVEPEAIYRAPAASEPEAIYRAPMSESSVSTGGTGTKNVFGAHEGAQTTYGNIALLKAMQSHAKPEADTAYTATLSASLPQANDGTDETYSVPRI